MKIGIARNLYSLLLLLGVSFFSNLASAQLHNYNPKDTFFYFSKYEFYLDKNSSDTGKLYLKLDSKLTDVEKKSSALYNGIYEFASFKIYKKIKEITVTLYDINKIKLKTETYIFKNIVVNRNDIYFYNLTSSERVLIWKVIAPVPKERTNRFPFSLSP